MTNWLHFVKRAETQRTDLTKPKAWKFPETLKAPNESVYTTKLIISVLIWPIIDHWSSRSEVTLFVYFNEIIESQRSTLRSLRYNAKTVCNGAVNISGSYLHVNNNEWKRLFINYACKCGNRIPMINEIIRVHLRLVVNNQITHGWHRKQMINISKIDWKKIKWVNTFRHSIFNTGALFLIILDFCV